MKLLSLILALALTGCATDQGFIGHPQTIVSFIYIGDLDRDGGQQD